MIRKLWYRTWQRPEPKAIILMYHRVNKLPCDPWELSVNPDHFDQQLCLIKQKWQPVSLTELTQRILNRSMLDRCVVFTFDDGYIDNFTEAKPLLEKYQIPATFFVATQNCETQTRFWWDELQKISLEAHELPETIKLSIAGEDVQYYLGEEATLTPLLQNKQRTWTATQVPPTRRCHLYLALWQRMKPLASAEQQQILMELNGLAGYVPAANAELNCVTSDHIQKLVENPLFSIGGHTVTHPELANHSVETQCQEISNGKSYLESIIKKPIELFAYPYGSFTDDTVKILEDVGIKSAVTTRGGPITTHSHMLQLNRYQVANWKGNVFESQLTRWFRS